MTTIRLHLLGLPHTICTNEYSHCAFTGKTLRFSPMMRSVGYEVYYYGIETSQSGATKQIDVFTVDEFNEYRKLAYNELWPNMTDDEIQMKLTDTKQFIGDLGDSTTTLYKEFNKRVNNLLKQNYRSISTDIICLPFAFAHNDALKDLSVVTVESGIGYDNAFANFRIYESYAKLHADYYKCRNGCNGVQHYWFICPNYYNIHEWPFTLQNVADKPTKIGFFGRITKCKGLDIFVEVAKRFPHIEFIMCGQGDHAQYTQSPNITYQSPIHGEERGKFLSSLTALIAPSVYLEPFCGVSVEAQLCGTPVISTDYGAFVENIEQFKTGLRCHTLADFCHGVQMAIDDKFDRTYIRDRAVKLFDMYEVAKKYDYAFKSIMDIHNGKGGWYSDTTYIDSMA